VTSPSYLFGHSDRELLRLERQAEFFAEPTEEILRLAGVKPGMRVLDIGCGVGDVSLIAGRLVGPQGAVLGIDRSAEALDVARRRAADADLTWVSFEETEIGALPGPRRFDAVVGRFILVHLAEPSAVLVQLQKLLNPAGVIAFLELDISSASITPPMPLFERCMDWIVQLYRRRGGNPDMGSQLYGVFRAAGLAPRVRGTCRVEGGPDAATYDYLSETIGTLVPNLEALGIATAEEIGSDLAGRLRAEAAAADSCVVFPRLIGAWAKAVPS
jgi:ubiquinone/menaquinone biosynthesis C-methylase UbiE